MKKYYMVIVTIFAMLLSACGAHDNPVATELDVAHGGTFPATVYENITDESTNPTVTDLDIITMPGHPRIWDSEELSHTVWDDVEKGKIRHPDANSKYQDTNLVYMDSMKGSSGDIVIRDIQVYLQNFTESPNLTLDDVLPIIKSYLPVSMADNYERANSFIAIPKDSEKETHYFIQYYPTDEAKASGNDYYGVAIEIQVDDGIVQLFRLSLSFPKWANYLDLNSYTKEPWDFDFLAN